MLQSTNMDMMQNLAVIKAKQSQEALKSVSNENFDPKEAKAVKEKTDQFEALLIKQLLDTAMKDSNQLFGEDPGDKIYQSMYRDEISKASGGSFGLSQMLFEHLQQNNKNI